MRRVVIATAIIVAATAAFAADAEKGKNQLSLFTSDLGFASTEQYSERTGGLGLALSHALTPHWAVELKVADERHYGGTITYTVPDPSVAPKVTYRTFHAIPVDLLTQYRFPNSSRWTPYVNAGVHYVSVPTMTHTLLVGDGQGNYRFREYTDVHSRTAGEIGGGTTLRITPHFGMRFDANFLLRSGKYYDDMFRTSVGVNWRF